MQAILAFSIVAALGLASGSLGIRGVRLGAAGVLFAGIFFGQLGMQYRRTILEFVRDFGLLLFCLYGWAAGRARFPFFGEAQRSSAQCLRRRCCFTGRTDRGWISISLSLFGPVIGGLFAGATTNTPSLATKDPKTRTGAANSPASNGRGSGAIAIPRIANVEIIRSAMEDTAITRQVVGGDR